MYIKDHFVRLNNLKSCLAQKKVSWRGFTGHDDFNKVKCSLIRYHLLLTYINNDVTCPVESDLPFTEHDNIHFTLNEHGIGYIEHKPKPLLAPLSSLSKAQAREVRRLAQETSEAALKLIINTRLIDYVATRNKYDYDSLMVLLESVSNYVTSVDALLEFNLKQLSDKERKEANRRMMRLSGLTVSTP